ncbi:hypothetical protein [Leisingera aquimarina]|uniref:hypothetical protein n=1 Tax=Leisingera aquimarina TaxID=476529 RepID=UPI000422E6B1|nr:hypothetical protein [Leisingera aquimarina]
MTGQPGMLAVDLDGTLRRSNILYESFWSSFGRDWKSPFTSAIALFQGRAALLLGTVTLLAVLPVNLIAFNVCVVTDLLDLNAARGRHLCFLTVLAVAVWSSMS